MKKDFLSLSGMHDGASHQIFENARRLRSKMTLTEKILWEELKNKKLGVKFRRQHPINCFILDFYCHERRLSVEIDGIHHYEKEQIEIDKNKTYYLQSMGIIEIRFDNIDITENLDLVLEKIRSFIK